MTATAQSRSQSHLHRAFELAEAAHLTGTARLVTESVHGEMYEVPSRDRRITHVVLVDHAGLTHCDCKAGQFGRDCAHAGAVDYYRRQRAVALARIDSRDEAMANWLAGFGW